MGQSCRSSQSNCTTFQHPIRPNSVCSSFPSVFFSPPSERILNRSERTVGWGQDRFYSAEFSPFWRQFGNSSLYFFIYFFRMKRCSKRKFFSKSSSTAGVVGKQVGEFELFLRFEWGELSDGVKSSPKQQYLWERVKSCSPQFSLGQSQGNLKKADISFEYYSIIINRISLYHKY